jgi:hypothetical protein
VVVPERLIIVALKLPDASRATIAELVLVDVAVVAVFGIDVKLAPDPLNPVAVKIPVEGTKVNLVLEAL